eukprot:TRINITY_DN74086_c0_g1_i1.p1 TRINITY_DN74086_c0_g1~~TRINITY_DN74086_c0_g1_i1.p1  ORF type:complete len:1190 (+),score=209.24 TRINITY_DN74086_c0_g1_i1:163-3732(+)
MSSPNAQPQTQPDPRRWIVLETNQTITVVDSRALPQGEDEAADVLLTVPVLTIDKRSGRAAESHRPRVDVVRGLRRISSASGAAGSPIGGGYPGSVAEGSPAAAYGSGARRAYAILGVLSADGVAAFLAVNKAECVCEVDGKPIFEVCGLDVIRIGAEVDPGGSKAASGATGAAACGPVFEGVVRLMTGRGFYFSQEFDITHTLQWKKRRVMEARRSGTDPVPRLVDGTPDLMAAADRRFVWNKKLVEQLTVQSTVSARWFAPVMQGSVQAVFTREPLPGAPGWELQLTLLLFSRRGSGRAGTRYNARGLDDNGEVGNLIETEQLARIRPARTSASASPCPAGVPHGWLSLVQLRGSVPLFWEQPPQGTVTITRDHVVTAPAFERHQSGTEEQYKGEVFYVNLLASKEPSEMLLTRALEQQLLSSEFHGEMGRSNRGRSYCHFDFHGKVKGASQAGLDADIEVLYNEIVQFLERSGYLNSTAETPSGLPSEPQQWQAGVLRTNCLDCLDRTNVVQFYVAWFWLRNFFRSRVALQPFLEASPECPAVSTAAGDKAAALQSATNALLDGGGAALQKLGRVGGSLFDGLGSRLGQATGQRGSSPGDDLLLDDDADDSTNGTSRDAKGGNVGTPPKLRLLLQELWADQGDRVSYQYTGAGSIMSTLLRTGKKSSYSVLEKSCIGINRAFQASFQDSQRQESIDLLLGLHKSVAPLPCLRGGGTVTGGLCPGEGGQGVGTVSMWVGTWNVGGKEEAWGSSALAGMAEWLGQEPADMACFCLQGVVELNAATAVMYSQGHEARAVQFEDAARRALAARWGDSYAKVRTVGAAGLLCIVFVREAMAALTRNVHVARLRSGSFGVAAGTRGAVAIRFEILSTSLCFLCVHMDAGKDKAQQRFSQLREGLRCFSDATAAIPIASEHDVLVVAGDFETCLDLPEGDNLEEVLRPSLRGCWAERPAVAVSNIAAMEEAPSPTAAASGGDSPVSPPKPTAWRPFLPYDQLTASLDHFGLTEGPVNFPPTYSLVPGLDDYDEAHLPSWADRVLHKTAGARLKAYRAARGLRTSEHRPVCAILEAIVFGSAADREELEVATCRRAIPCGTAAASSLAIAAPPPPPLTTSKPEEPVPTGTAAANIANAASGDQVEARQRGESSLFGPSVGASVCVEAAPVKSETPCEESSAREPMDDEIDMDLL